MANGIEIIENPGEDWLLRVHRGYEVWLPKEHQKARVIFPFHHDVARFIHERKLGSIGISRAIFWSDAFIEDWMVDSNGYGFDGLPIIQPLVGNLSDQIVDPIDAEKMERRLRHLEKLVSMLMALK